jgi:MFS family permease
MTTSADDAEDPAARAVFARVAWRLLPLVTLAYIVNFLDRTNVGFAAITMNRAVGLTPTQFGVGAGTLFLGYCLFEVPSNLALYRFGARVWLCRIMVTWGLVSAATVFVHGPASFYALRFLLGAAEAGFFPGVAFFLAEWFPAQFRARVYAWFLLGIPLSSVVGGPLSGALLGLDGVWGLAGWQWLYIAEGLPAVVLGVLIYLTLSNGPEQAAWLSPAEKRLVRARLDGERRPDERRSLMAGLRDRRVLMIAAVQFTYTIGAYGIGIYLPLIIKAQRFDNFTVGLLTAAPSLLACVAMVIWARLVDRSPRKLLHLAGMCFISGAGLVLAVATGSFAIAFAGLTAVVVGTNAARAVLWTIPTRFLSGIASAGGLALINSVGIVGGFVGPSIMGYTQGLTHSFAAGLTVLAGFFFLSIALIGVLSRMMKEAPKRVLLA